MFDVIGIGFGPANLALAIAMEESGCGLRARFIEAASGPGWQSAMMLDGSDIQHNPVRDLVSLRNPRSRFSFINFLFEHDRLLAHLNLPMEFPFRKEYGQYISWAAGHFADRVDYGTRAVAIEVRYDAAAEPYYVVRSDAGREYHARSLVIGTGRTPYVPAPFDTVTSERVFHLTSYLPALDRLAAEAAEKGSDWPPQHVVVVGGSQSAIELTLDLSRRFPRARVSTYCRPYAPREKDTSPFSEESYFPEFTDLYFAADRAGKASLDAQLRLTNYSAADGDVLRELYCLIYEQRLDDAQRVFVHGNNDILAIHDDGATQRLTLRDRVAGHMTEVAADLVVLATGFRDLGPAKHQERHPRIMDAIGDRFTVDQHGYLVIDSDYHVEPVGSSMPPLFLNGLCESTHGIGDAGSFSLLSIRAQRLLDGLNKRLP